MTERVFDLERVPPMKTPAYGMKLSPLTLASEYIQVRVRPFSELMLRFCGSPNSFTRSASVVSPFLIWEILPSSKLLPTEAQLTAKRAREHRIPERDRND